MTREIKNVLGDKLKHIDDVYQRPQPQNQQQQQKPRQPDTTPLTQQQQQQQAQHVVPALPESNADQWLIDAMADSTGDPLRNLICRDSSS